MFVHLLLQGFEEVLGCVRRPAAEDDAQGSVHVYRAHQQPAQVAGPVLQLVHAESVLALHAANYGLEVDGVGIFEVLVAQDRGNAACQPVPHLLRQGRGRAHHLGRAPRIGQAQPPAESLHDDMAHLRPELEMRVAQNFAVEQDTGTDARADGDGHRPVQIPR